MNDRELLVVEKLNKKYKDFSLQDISFTLPEGYILGLIGKNGAGKTTLMNCIIGAIPFEGTVCVEGAVNTLHKRAATEKIGFIVEKAPFFKKETLGKNGELLGVLYDDWDEKKFYDYLKKLELHYDMVYGELSKGMETKFQLAFALAHSPRLLILDEPTGGLDPVFRKNFLKILQNVVNEEMLSVIISTHLTTDLDKVADYVMMLDEGKIVFYEDKENLSDKYPLISGNTAVLSEIPKSAYKRVKRKGNIFHTVLTDAKYLVKHPEVAEKVQIERTNLEEIMYYLCTPSMFSEKEEN
ncbi:MAG: ABC transporter ATP-binding protein [Lachnospiraceae bacterium]|nr:ABC transporter ATP-binding protein [Lachnospiraceae bacterium]